MQERQVALALARAPVGHPQQPRELVPAQRAGLATRDALRSHGADRRVRIERLSELTQRRQVLGDRRRRPAGAFELIAVGL
jgi:hypothetical protein